MLLENKVAIVYGAGGTIGGAVAKGFAREGARVFLAGRTQEKLDRVADEVRSAGGTANVAVLDALDEAAVDAYVDDIAKQAGRVDISMNVIGIGDIQEPLMEISLDDFLQPIQFAMRTQFLTTRAAARHMTKNGGGVVLAFGGNGNQTEAGLGGFKVALDAIEGLRRQWALELGKQGIRVVTLKTGGIVESIGDDAGMAEVIETLKEAAMLPYTATLEDVARVAAFVASDHGRTLTSTEINISCGSLVD